MAAVTATREPTGPGGIRFSPRLVVLACLACVPAALTAGPAGGPDAPMLVLMGALVLVVVRLAMVDEHVDATRRERVAVGVLVATALVIVAIAVRSALPAGAWLGAFAAATVGLTAVRRTRMRLLAQGGVVAALLLVLVPGTDLTSAVGVVMVLGPMLLVAAIAALSSALADDLALARQREWATRRAAERRAELLEAVRELSRAGPGQAVDITVEALRGLGFPVAAVLLEEQGVLRPHRVDGIEPRDDIGTGISGHALETGRTVISGDYRRDELRLPGLDLGAVVATPIPAADRNLGVLVVGLHEPGAPPHGDIEVVEVLAAHLGGALATERVVHNQDALLARLRDLDGLRASFVDRVSEDLRDPLTVVRGVAQTLAAYGDRLPDEQRRDLLARLTAQAGDLSDTLEALLDFSRVHVGRADPRPERVDALELLAPGLAGTGIEVHVDGRPIVVVDRALVHRAFELLRRATIDVDDGLRLVQGPDVLGVDVHLRQLDALQGGFARALAEQLLVAAGARTQRLPRGLRLLLPLASDDTPAGGVPIVDTDEVLEPEAGP